MEERVRDGGQRGGAGQVTEGRAGCCEAVVMNLKQGKG